MLSLQERILTKIVASPDGCWLLDAYICKNGYGKIWNGKRSDWAHRVSYSAFVGPIPVGLDLDHLCRVRACVNPWHLEPVTRKVNYNRSPLSNSRVTHCPSGHPYSPENTGVFRQARAGGFGRYCRECDKARRKANHQRERDRRELALKVGGV